MRQIVPVHLSHNAILLAVLTILGAQMALPVPALAFPASASPAGIAPDAAQVAPVANPAVVPVGAPVGVPAAALQHRAGYPTTREKWRYCPRDGSHPCVDLDIPGVTEPETPTGQ